ncbi:hypothetical protein Kfla_4823 [Kribbella flavida DSM 17836]|uniref:Uncharacterized protein n=1 Tax=Kribbella flavida (strain DSM 17836 / JCM 10339 / NBRC 14399) TaxID=479435 RepID=D2Q0P0_KRIFD|nr:hypothetical protein [Kribbella flavida]ADB33840.1 hypothetical protein Kfla_4823 [Kribbella flavida DSM 17836]
MRTTIAARLAVTLATAAAAVAGTVAIAQPASAATANTCLQQLTGAQQWGYDQTMTTRGRLKFFTDWPSSESYCKDMSVSLGISRTNTAFFRNQNAVRETSAHRISTFSATFGFGTDGYGQWMIRQIAVKDRAGRVAVKTFTRQTTPRVLTLRFQSTVNAGPKGTLVPKAGKLLVSGNLKAWHYTGRQVNVQNQQVLVQVRRPGTSTYVTRATMTSNQLGNFATNLATAGLKGSAVRVAFYSKIPTVASQWQYLGTIA